MRFVTYNIQFGRGKDERLDLERIAKEVKGADIIAMQEVERFAKRSRMVDQVAELVRLLPGYYWIYGPGLDLDASFTDESGLLQSRRWQFGNLLMSRAPILSARNHLLPKMDLANELSLQRAALEGVIECPRGPVRVYSLHLGHKSDVERERQVARLLEIQRWAPTEGGVFSGGSDLRDWVDERLIPPMPHEVIMLGDFNMEPDSREYEIMTGALTGKGDASTNVDVLVDSWLVAGNDPTDGVTDLEDNARIDFVFVSGGLASRVCTARVDKDAKGSDHQPLWVDIDL